MSERTRGGRALETEAFARISHEAVFSGHYLQVSVDRFRYPDGREANREIVDGGDVVVVCAYDKEGVFLVGQPREAAGEALLWELPAGAVDTADKEILEAAQRELAEEIGKGAHHWELVRTFYSSPGGLSERMHLYFATNLFDYELLGDENGRITTRKVPFEDLEKCLRENEDGKTIIGLTELTARLQLR